MHPPGVALAMRLGGDRVRSPGFGFALSPLRVASGVMVVLAMLSNRATARVRRFRPATERRSHGSADRAPGRRFGPVRVVDRVAAPDPAAPRLHPSGRFAATPHRRLAGAGTAPAALASIVPTLALDRPLATLTAPLARLAHTLRSR